MNSLIGVLAVQGDVREHARSLESLGAATRLVRRPEELDGLDGIVLPGGESTTMDKLLRAFDLRDPLRERLQAGLPAYGSCAGMILLADHVLDATADQQTLGGLDVTVRRNAFGRQVDSFEEDLSMPAVMGERTDPVRAVFIRAPWVESVGPDVQVLGTVTTGPAAGRIVAVQQNNLLATSFHPEVTGDHRIHEYFLRMAQR
ncbi:pyridoxal 5'-phosphate synthase subunit PdxT [Flexivirga endophytica]|uniref:Pyridoxal 5'-phosphate synthase subunit PdxT n=1 Tax=Flexivirga endophytica TaxID=1849103 RepID=A0A916T9P0_9MICO|nr:pyridoxal 5'-phosphate synthase glutaminase subunit PdxT [Flexivirga endophytica]GGB37078.1 pyridoxal 5'-phosphate synthase subunit PdxT [Flexivirga endophytica]GHB44648.1 pyridoxal 5'-phosphate synthase subunit PdxT [Flexivirga endophytica]